MYPNTVRSNSETGPPRGRGGRGRRSRSRPSPRKARPGSESKRRRPTDRNAGRRRASGGRGRDRDRDRGRGGRGGRGRTTQSRQTATMKAITISENSIHCQWKQQMGGLIRYYINERMNARDGNNVSQKQAEQEVEQMYSNNGCSLEQTKIAILSALGMTKDDQSDWVEVKMVIDERDLANKPSNVDSYTPSHDGKGLILPQIQRPGEGPAHAHERWTNVVVPPWAVGRSFYFQVVNRSKINLSCEITLDDHVVAKNAPLPPSKIRTVKPDNKRYFETHKWTLQPARRVRLDEVEDDDGGEMMKEDSSSDRRNTPRYNGVRPNYNGERLHMQQYPDPTYFGWTFTGSVERSKVEFFEKKSNIGLTKMDFYYTTGTIKTILDHPTTGRNALFRGKVSPEQFESICKNPRAHTSRGYRRRGDRPTDSAVETQGNDRAVDVDMDMEEEDEFDQELDTSTTTDNYESVATTTTESINNNNTTTYYAKNENYDFKTQGHLNRMNEMTKLHHDRKFSKWEQAAKKEYSVVHAKFFISIPKRMPRDALSRNGPSSGRARDREREPLPEQASVIDVKAAENATLGTKFVATGPSQTTRRSTVKMNRINGLNDDVQWKGGPLFEKKLFYRAEDVILDHDMDAEEEDIVNDMKMATAEGGSFDLEDYKLEKMGQVTQYHAENQILNPDDADTLLQDCQHKILSCQSMGDVDEVVKVYYSQLIQREFNRNPVG